jgi:hypothetical protein
MKKEDLIFAFHSAMLYNIKTNFRMICIDWNNEDWIKIRVYTDTEPSEEDYELIACILTDLDQQVVFGRWIKEVVYSEIQLLELDRLKCVLYARHE